MKDAELVARVEDASLRTRSRLRGLIFGLECALVLVLIAWWLLAGRQGHTNAYLVLFLYCFPSEFLIAPLPHEPVLLYFGRNHPAGMVALVSVAGTLLVEAINYQAFGFVADSQRMRAAVSSRWLVRLVALFQRRPFLALLAGGLAPLPFYPLRCLVVLAHYPLWRYLLAVALARMPRFYLLALLGVSSVLPDSVWVALSVVLVVALLAPFVSRSRRPRTDIEPTLPEGDPTRA